MIPTTILLECGPCYERGRPVDIQPTLAHPIGQRWADVRRVFDETVGSVPIYVMSLSNEGLVIGAWDMRDNVRPLTSGAVRLFQENPQTQWALAGPVAASEFVLICGNEPFRQAAHTAALDAVGDHHVSIHKFDSNGHELGGDRWDAFERCVGWASQEDTEDAKARLYREIDMLGAMYDGRINVEVRQYRQRLRVELRRLIDAEEGAS